MSYKLYREDITRLREDMHFFVQPFNSEKVVFKLKVSIYNNNK